MSQNVFDDFSPVHHCASQESSAQSPSTFGDILYTATDIFNSTVPGDQETAVSSVLKSVTEYLEAETALVYLYDWDREIFSVIGAWPQYYAQRHMPFQASLSVIPPDISSQLRRGEISLSSFHRGVRSAGALTIPMMAGGCVIGACCYTGIPGGKRRRESIIGELKLFGALLAGFLLRIRSEQSLSETRESVEQLLDSTHDGIGMLDRECTILRVNKEFAARLGKKPEELIGCSLDNVIPASQYGDFFKRRQAVIKQTFQTKQPAFLEDCLDGRWFGNRFFPVFKDGKVIAVTILSTDITDRKRLEAEKEVRLALETQAAERQKREQEYLEILDSATEGNFVVDFENDSTHYSDKWMKRFNLIGLPPSKLLEHFFNRMDPNDVSRIKTDRGKAETLKVPKFRREYHIADKDGHPLWILIQGKLIYSDDGRLIKTYGTFIDITERKEMELALRKQADDLTEQHRLINNFFLSISHEFRTPLAVLLMQLDMMGIHLNEARCEYSGGIKKVNREMRANVYRLMHLIGNILDITKAESGYDSPVLTDTDIVALTAEITDAVDDYLNGSGPDISFITDTPSRIIPADSDKLEKILLNLLSNAVEHSPKNGCVHITLRNAGSSVLFTVSDEGNGIPEDTIGRIFDRFRQADFQARTHEGCGIGLSLTRALTELLGGRICVDSRPGHGARFFVELPVLRSATPSQSITQDGLSLAERIQIAFSEVRIK